MEGLRGKGREKIKDYFFRNDFITIFFWGKHALMKHARADKSETESCNLIVW